MALLFMNRFGLKSQVTGAREISSYRIGKEIQCSWWLFSRLLRRCSHTRSGGRRFGPDWRPLPPLLCRS
jgi:hypothetical protein